ncbi:glucosidase [Capsulimonas corticalis]|uniref:Glucosidase n=1 Tax=Capsulimonas corticalis TaxID=2219043 RepID=A0A402D4B1_9BACT|nr:glucosidase [Capsulimonas corticalis]BDI29170.1 glucosidase [Capsulimonas corticalis]
MNAEEIRLAQSRERKAHWKRWGPYLSDRAWGTVREDYSADGSAWDYLSHDLSRSVAYRWNEDGLGGICDRHQKICFAPAFWNHKDSILKERLFGVTGTQGNHGEDVKEYYFYVDSTPTHSYMKFLYKYPQAAYPYADLTNVNIRRGKHESEYELLDTGIFDEDRYFDIVVEYAKASVEDILVKITAYNRGPEAAPIDLLPTVWFRNTWSWGDDADRPTLRLEEDGAAGRKVILLHEESYGERRLYCAGDPDLLFTDNETNRHRLGMAPGASQFCKDGVNRYLVGKHEDAVNPARTGTKAAAHYTMTVEAGGSKSVTLRFTDGVLEADAKYPLGVDFDDIFAARIREADEFYAGVIPKTLSTDAQSVMRQALAGMLWSKQFYHYEVQRWLEGDPGYSKLPRSRMEGRNHDWSHLYSADVLSMPDKWEYPWFAAWDLAFHCIPLALVDSEFSKDQLSLMVREWYMHPNGQLPAYEWAMGDVNPPVHAWAAFRVYKMEEKRLGVSDRPFLERVFHKLLLNFTWWVNRKDPEGRNVFQGGFLGLDNIGIFDRSRPLPTGGHLDQSDGTSWMAMFTLNLLAIAMELAKENPAYEDVASKFWEHFLYISEAMNSLGSEGEGLWDREDGFFYDVLHLPDGRRMPVKIRSIVGLIPLFAVETLEADALENLAGFHRRMEWFVEHRPDLVRNVACMETPGTRERRLLSIVSPSQLRAILRVMLDEEEFLSPYGIRAVSRYHKDHPYIFEVDGVEHRVDYEPAESSDGLFGGNSNWRGPIWMPINYLIIESLQKYHYYLGDDFKVECPTGSGNMLTLWEVAAELSHRLTHLFAHDEAGRRPVYGYAEKFQNDPHWKDLILFYEYFHGDNGAGIGASHQTGWTGLVAKLMQQSGE